MIPGLNKKDVEMLGGLVLMHKQKVMDYTRAVPNLGMAKRHGQFVETLLKVQTIAGGDLPSCQGCVREGGKRRQWMQHLLPAFRSDRQLQTPQTLISRECAEPCAHPGDENRQSVLVL